MTNALAHRGPDGEGYWNEGPVGLGHRRLAVIDLSPEAGQPMMSRDGRFVITYNGEVYNYLELRRELLKQGSRFATLSDTEVVLEAVSQWGIDRAIRRFNGMFAFAIWDRRERRLLLGRDRYGIKPLYLWQSRDLVAFASEPKAFRTLSGFSPTVDPLGIAEYLTFQNIISNRTALKDVSVFPAGHWAEISLAGTGVEFHEYWDFCFTAPDPVASTREYVEEFRFLLTQAVLRSLVSDVEVGAYLSGGLDSGSIAALASQKIPNLKTFTIGFELDAVLDEERLYDERAAAERIASSIGSTQIEMIIGPRHVPPAIEVLARHLDEPRMGQSYPNLYAAKLASSFVKVALAGTGGDEILGGYPWRYPPMGMADHHFEDWHLAKWQRVLSCEDLKKALSPLASDLRDFDPREVYRAVSRRRQPADSDTGDPLSLALYFEAKTFLPGLLSVEDRVSMAYGLEVRLPFLDNDLVDFCQQLPRSLRISGGRRGLNHPGESPQTAQGKWILRKALIGALPNETLNSAKQGFAAPDSKWFANELRYSLVSSIRQVDPSLADRLTLEAIVHRGLSQGAKARSVSWSLLLATQYLRRFNSVQ